LLYYFNVTNGSFCCFVILNLCLQIRFIIFTHQFDVLTLQKAFKVIALYMIIRLPICTATMPSSI
jgi:hypothetical protein